MQTLEHVFTMYGIEGPYRWVAEQRTAEHPSEREWSEELFTACGLQKIDDKKLIQAVVEGGIVLSGDRIPGSCPVAHILFRLLSPEKVSWFECHPNTVLMVDVTEKPQGCLYMDNNRIFPSPSLTALFALWESWNRNSDRERAYKARNYLCNIVEEALLSHEKTAS